MHHDPIYRTEHALRLYGRMRESSGYQCAIGKSATMPRGDSYRPTTQDRICWMLDVERALARLPKIERDVIEITLLQKRSLERAAFILGRSIRTIVRRRNDALERLAAMPEFRA
jgi:hypothetical protein